MRKIFIPIFVAVLFFGAFGFVNFAKATCDKPKGTISVSPSTYEINKDFTIRLVGSDDNDIKYLRICYHTGGDSQGVEKCKEAHFLSPFGLGLDKTGKLNWTLHKEEPGTYIFYGKITDSDKEGGFDACTVDHIDEPSDPESVTVKVIISSPESICDYESYTDRAGETKSADGWCTGRAACSGGNCGDDTYDFCVGNTWYHFGCKCTLLNCSCDSSKAATPKNCPGGCIKWACDDEGCSGGACNTTPPPTCTPNGCNGNCPSNCNVAQDPDCGCQNNDGCCGIGCTDIDDNNCTAGCPPGQIMPHKKCVDTTTCQSIDSCGVNECETPTQCAAGPPPTCGNGVVESGEGCDDGNTVSGDGCSSACQIEGGGGGGIITIEPPITATSFEALVAGITNFIFIIALVLAPLMIIIGAIYLLTSGGDPKKLETGKNIIIYTLIGLAIILLAKGLIAVLKTIIGVK